MIKRYRFVISGYVQGVGFRYFTQDTAYSLNLSGWVRNAYDGSVEGEVQGDEAACSSFFDIIREGPTLARVKQCIIDECTLQENEREFNITG
jgi:acylphosphatase